MVASKDVEMSVLIVPRQKELSLQLSRQLYLPNLDPNQQVTRHTNDVMETNAVNRSVQTFDPLRYLIPVTEFVLVVWAILIILSMIIVIAVTILGIYRTDGIRHLPKIFWKVEKFWMVWYCETRIRQKTIESTWNMFISIWNRSYFFSIHLSFKIRISEE